MNYIAILGAAIVNMVVGMAWYTPKGLFGKSWMQEMGFAKLSKQQSAAMKSKCTQSMVLGFVSALVIAFVLSKVLAAFGTVGWLAGMKVSFSVWLGFFATVTLGAVLWEGKSWKLYFINAGYWLVSLALMAAVLAQWA